MDILIEVQCKWLRPGCHGRADPPAVTTASTIYRVYSVQPFHSTCGIIITSAPSWSFAWAVMAVDTIPLSTDS